MRKLLILFLVFLTLIIYFSSIIVLSLPSHNIPYDVRTLYNEATSLRANVLRIMEINKEKGLLFYDIEQMFKIADKYYQRGISALSQNKYYLAKFSFLKAINYYYVVEDMCAQIQKQAVFCTLVVLLIIIFASFALAGLLVEESLIKRFVVSACFFTISLIILYNFHPGFAIILPPNDPIFWRKIIFYSTTFIVLFYLFFIEFPRESTERMRIAKQVKPGEFIMLMFAGVCPYGIVIAKHQPKIKKIVAIEINPIAYKYMVENIKLNKLEDKIIPVLGDVKDKAKYWYGMCDRVIMPLPKGLTYSLMKLSIV